jgi:hypothetical protein
LYHKCNGEVKRDALKKYYYCPSEVVLESLAGYYAFGQGFQITYLWPARQEFGRTG